MFSFIHYWNVTRKVLIDSAWFPSSWLIFFIWIYRKEHRREDCGSEEVESPRFKENFERLGWDVRGLHWKGRLYQADRTAQTKICQGRLVRHNLSLDLLLLTKLISLDRIKIARVSAGILSNKQKTFLYFFLFKNLPSHYARWLPVAAALSGMQLVGQALNLAWTEERENHCVRHWNNPSPAKLNESKNDERRLVFNEITNGSQAK